MEIGFFEDEKIKWRWEFFRRSDEAAVAWDQIQAARRLDSYPSKEERELCAEIGICPPMPDIRLCWEEIGDPTVKSDRRTYSGQGMAEYFLVRASMRRRDAVITETDVPYKLNIGLDLTRIRSLDETMIYIRDVVDCYAAEQGIDVAGLNWGANERIDLILEAGRMWDDGTPYDSIGAALFNNSVLPTDPKNADAVRSKAKRSIKRYKELISSWRKI